MFFKSSVAVALAGLSAGVLAANNLNFIYSRSDFSTIGGSAGNEYGHSSGFVLTADDGTELFSTASPNGGTSCAHVTGGTDFGLTSTCWDGTYTFHCWSDFAGHPNTCNVHDPDNIQWDGEADDSTVFTGISISQDGWCGGPIYAGPGNCSPDDTYTVVSV
ncbi:hypothetical protein MGN70_014058 [Eutypa lata]|uniref:Uncharacterized protein n=1 Tax=Eutypa lata (strain UCR-EL1) TaxID=1287681 RepID=M7TQL1_EUTLA|nr:hypothetical protein UCREL1_772 [Eutypa lata UCREL1]KAI1244188.1 hypothetical protein MGN70_014058 [Eutypa lata]